VYPANQHHNEKTVSGTICVSIGTVIAPGVGTAIGASLGGQLGNFVEKLKGKGMEAEANRRDTVDAFASAWEDQMPSAMNMNAMLKDVSGSLAENTKNIRDSFNRAAKAANEFGYSMEEGMEVVQDMARHGLGEKSVAAAERVFRYERSTGADRNVLMQAEGRFSRFGGGDALQYGYAGTFASGMQKGQYTEFLRAMQQIFEDGISKGFVKGAKEIAGDMSFFSKLTGGSEFWKGEQGAKRIAQASTTVANSVNLASVPDIINFQAALEVAKGSKNIWQAEDGLGYKTTWRGDDIDARIMLERGFTPELFGQQWKSLDTLYNKDNRSGMVAGIQSLTGFKWNTSAQLYEDVLKELEKNPDFKFDNEKAQAFIDKYDKPGNYASEELNLSKAVEGLRTAVANMGMGAIELKLKHIPDIYHDLHDIWKYSVEDKIKEEREEAAKRYFKDYDPKSAVYRLLNTFGEDGVSASTFRSGVIWESQHDERFSEFNKIPGLKYEDMNDAVQWTVLKDAIVDAIKDDGMITVVELRKLVSLMKEESVELLFYQNPDLWRR
jgi:hypothetical protein